jgi:hypothetical protein
MSLDILIREINTVTETFEYGNESEALRNLIAICSDPRLLKDVQLDNTERNAEFVEALDRLSEFKDKIESEFNDKNEYKLYVARIYNLGEHARRNLNTR